MAEARLRSHRLMWSALAAVIIAVGYVAVIGLNQTTWAANCDANRVNCNSSEWQAYNDCAVGDVGAIWFNTGDRGANNTGGYYTDVVNVNATTNSVTVNIRGSACNRTGPSGYGVYATDIRPGSDTDSQRLSMTGGDILYRGSFNGNRWTTMGSDLTATLNVSGLATNNIGKEDTASITVQLGRCYNGSASNRGWDGNPNSRCYYNPVVVNIRRDARPSPWTINAQSYIKKSNSPSENTSSGFSQPGGSITASPGDYLYWAHDLRVQDSSINQYFGWTMRWSGFPADFNNGGNQYIHWEGNVNEAQNSLFVRRGAIPSYDPSYTIYRVRSSDAGNNLCQRIEWQPTSWNNSAASGTAYRCAYIPYNFSLVPSVTSPSDGGIIESDQDTVDVAGQITNNGPTKSGTDVNWRITQINYAPSVSTIPNRSGGTGGDPCSYFTGEQSCNVLNQGNESDGFAYPSAKTYTANNGQLSNNPVGTKICFVLSVNKYNAANMGNANAWRHSALNCLIVGKKPKVQVWGGGVSAGKVFNGTSLQSSSKIATSVTSKKTGVPVMPVSSSGISCASNGLRTVPEVMTKESSNFDVYPSVSFCDSSQVTKSVIKGEKFDIVSEVRNAGDTKTPNANDPDRHIPYTIYAYRVNSGDATTKSKIANAFTKTSPSNTGSIRYAESNFDDTSAVGCSWFSNTFGSTGNCSVTPYNSTQKTIQFESNSHGEYNYIGSYYDGSRLTLDTSGYNVGDEVCYFLAVRRFDNAHNFRAAAQDSSNLSRRISKPVCVDIINSDPIATANVFGSWSEYGIYAPSTINLMSSSSGLNGGSTSGTQSSWSKLTFTNQITSPATQNDCRTIRYGCYSSARTTLPDPSNTFSYSSAVEQSGSSWNLSTLIKGRNIKPSTGVTTLNLTSNSITLDSGQWLVINAPNSTVNITNDLRYTTSGSLSRADQIPQLIIIAGRINIASNVTQVDAWLIAKNGTTLDGRINTCSTTNTGVDLPITQNLSSSLCDKTLRVNGPVVANMLYLRRTAGSGVKEQSGDPAEVFNLRPDAYIWARAKTEALGSLTTTYMVELPPRY